MDNLYETKELMQPMASGSFARRKSAEELIIEDLRKELAALKANTFSNKLAKTWHQFCNRIYNLIPMRECNKDHYEDYD